MNALILVDLQKDFLPGGALAVKGGEQIIPLLNRVMEKNFNFILATKDWHPYTHCSFAEVHGKQPGEIIHLSGIDQILWPMHCVQDTWGSEFAQGLNTAPIEKIFYKGIDKNRDSYSTFFDNGRGRSTGLELYLRDHDIKDLYIGGLTTDYCVKYSVLDALILGFNVYVIKDACRAVNLKSEDENRALDEMRNSGAHIILSKEIT